MAHEFTIRSAYKLKSGYQMPVLGYGVYKTPPAVTEEVTLKAFQVGYRHVDSAIMYGNEAPCARAIQKSGIPRSEVFFTTKIPTSMMGYEKAKAAIANSLKEAEQQYFDLILIHAPYGGKEARLGTWRALVEAQKEGKVRSIGVSNYGVHHLEELQKYIEEGGGGSIDVGQYELHPWLPRPDIVGWLKEHNAIAQAYCPVVRAEKMDDPAVQTLAAKHKKTPAQILIRWSLQKGFVPLPKSVTPSRIEENAAVFDFQLSDEDMASLEFDSYAPIAWDPTVDQS